MEVVAAGPARPRRRGDGRATESCSVPRHMLDFPPLATTPSGRSPLGDRTVLTSPLTRVEADMSVRRLQPSLLRGPVRARHGALVLALGVLAGCSGGVAADGSAGVDCGLAGASTICLDSCNLGCSATGCSQTDIAQNQIVILNFSENVDAASVNSSSIRFRTATGGEPVGEFFVEGRTVRFQPTLAITGGQTFFGFTSGETYTMTIPGGASQTSVVRSTSGRPFDATLTCTLRSSLGIIDLNGVPPRAALVVPTEQQIGSAPRDTDIVLEFNELIDATPFLSGTQSPVTFSVRRNRETTAGSGVYECNPNSAPQTLSGTQTLDFDASRGISVLSFRPTQALPGNICVEVNVTDGVADLSGRPAQPQTFTFRTVIVPLTETSIVEPFDDDDQLDADASAADWAGGTATFCRIGGDGRHGAFSLALCTDTLTTVEGKRVYTLSTDNTVIPGSNTNPGSPIPITDGRFFFTTMVVPSDARIKFIGSQPPQVTVAGRLDVLGHNDCSGANAAAPPLSSVLPGQAGGVAGPGGGNGGKGGDKVSLAQATTTGANAANQGVNGQDARVLAGHAYATTVLNSGGRGSTVYPASGLNTAIYYGALTGVPYSPMASAGGGGGGYLAAGQQGVVVTNNHPEPGLLNVATSALTPPTATTITAAAAGVGNPAFPWYANRYVGRTLEILSGTGATQTATITQNGGPNNATFTVSAAWSVTPDATSVFRVIGGPAPLAYAIGPSANAGTAVQLFPIPAGPGVQPPSVHFLVGGSGGGGGASHACMSLGITGTDRFAPGCGGGGGGGAISLRAGRILGIAPAAKILANGGSAANSTGTASGAQACVAGGGSGGSIVLQTGKDLQILGGLIDVRGGTGGTFNRTAGASNGAPPQGAAVQIQGGNGAAGFVRLEAPTPPALTALAGMQPAATADNVGALAENDALVVCSSKVYSTGQVFGPEFARYEIRGTVDGTPFVLSDDPAVSPTPAGQFQPIRALFQAVQVDLSTGAPLQFGPWRSSVRSTLNVTGIDADALNAVRFQLFADYAIGAVILVDEVRVVYRI